MRFRRAFGATLNDVRRGLPLQAAARANIRFMFHAMVTRLHSPWTLSRQRRRNWRKPAVDPARPPQPLNHISTLATGPVPL
jgi:hypothetical protein